MRIDLVGIARTAMDMPVYPSDMFSPSNYYRFLLALASVVKPSLSVELGVCTGGGSLHLALGHSQGRVIGVDSVLEYPEHVRYVQSVCPTFEFWMMDSVESAAKVSELGLMVDILFIDTNHRYEQTVKEFEAYLPLLADVAIVLFDDTQVPGVQRAFVEMVPDRAHIELDFLHSESGFGVILMGSES